jgi:hypothetical protein
MSNESFQVINRSFKDDEEIEEVVRDLIENSLYEEATREIILDWLHRALVFRVAMEQLL